MTAVVEVAKEASAEPLPKTVTIDDADDDSSCGQSEPNGSDSEPKDSGVDCGSEPPDQETSAAILKQIEYYLSDVNVLKDPFLLKHVRRNKEGYVSVKLLASFRKVRGLCSSWESVSHSLGKSRVLQLNHDGSKVRRLTPLPDHDETAQSRTVLAHGFAPPCDRPGVESVSEAFAAYGDIALVRILRPGGSAPTDVKRFLAKNPEIQSQVCALVEFEDHASAKRAAEGAHQGFKVLPLVGKDALFDPESPKESPKKKKKRNKRPSKGSDLLSDADYQSRRGSSGSLSSQSSGYLSSSPGSSFIDFRRRHSLNPNYNNDPGSSFASLGQRHFGSRGTAERIPQPIGSPSPWRLRRQEQQQMMMSDSNLSSAGGTSASALSLPVKTIRMPKGPDGTKGFGPRLGARLPSTAE